MLVNVFASWCVPCRIEHPIVTRLAEQGVIVQAINYKDRPEDAQGLAGRARRPLSASSAPTATGRVGIDWGVYGVPETYVIDKDGRIAYRHVGPLQAQDLDRTILPLLEQLQVIRSSCVLFLLLAGPALAATSPARCCRIAALEARARALGQGAALPRLPEPVDRRFRCRPRPRPAPARARAPGRRRQRCAGARPTSPSATATSSCSSRR